MWACVRLLTSLFEACVLRFVGAYSSAPSAARISACVVVPMGVSPSEYIVCLSDIGGWASGVVLVAFADCFRDVYITEAFGYSACLLGRDMPIQCTCIACILGLGRAHLWAGGLGGVDLTH
jgi:hypothetical protein